METRKNIRLTGYDYSQNGVYFVTVCTRNREALLWDADAPVGADVGERQDILLSGAGRIVEQAIQNIPIFYNGICVEKYVIMPNHVHMLLALESGRMISAPTISAVIGSMKRWVSRQYGRPLWQRSFYDHIIRDEHDFLTKRNYIDTNPARWREDEYCEG